MAAYPDQRALAAASGVDQATVSRMERFPGPYALATVERVARALGVAIEALAETGTPSADGAGAALVEAVLKVVQKRPSKAELRRWSREFSAAARLLAEKAGDGTVKSEYKPLTTVQKMRRPPIVRDMAHA